MNKHDQGDHHVTAAHEHAYRAAVVPVCFACGNPARYVYVRSTGQQSSCGRPSCERAYGSGHLRAVNQLRAIAHTSQWRRVLIEAADDIEAMGAWSPPKGDE